MGQLAVTVMILLWIRRLSTSQPSERFVWRFLRWRRAWLACRRPLEVAFSHLDPSGQPQWRVKFEDAAEVEIDGGRNRLPGGQIV